VPARPLDVLVYRGDGEAPRFAALIRAPRGRVRVHTAAALDDAARVAGDVEVIFGWRVPPALYATTGRLRWLQAMGAGVDWALGPELPAHVTITRVPGVFGPWMAEYVLGWCAAVTQRIETYRAAQRERRWIDTTLPTRLGGTTLAIVGLGDIGRTIARTARAVGMRVVGVSRSGARVAGVERVYRVAAIRRALAVADWVVLTVPLTASTRGLIGAPELAAMKPTAWLLNIARGPVVDEDALVDTLRRRAIAGAVLDVFAREPLPPDHPLWALDTVAVTPHIAGPDVPEEIVPVFSDNLARFLAGRPLRHVVDRRRGY
jgi:phosphoglycerate dehydrogenase-like enzyme